jgi:hypothetical protein
VPIWESNLPEIFLPYRTIDVIANHTNVWANIQHLDLVLIEFDLEKPELWLPLFADAFPAHKLTSQYPHTPFFEQGAQKLRIPTPLSTALVERLEVDIHEELKAHFVMYRSKVYLGYRWLPEIESKLREGLIVMEFE